MTGGYTARLDGVTGAGHDGRHGRAPSAISTARCRSRTTPRPCRRELRLPGDTARTQAAGPLHPVRRRADPREPLARRSLVGEYSARRPQRTGHDVRLQPVPAAVPAAGPRHRGVDDPGRPPRRRSRNYFAVHVDDVFLARRPLGHRRSTAPRATSTARAARADARPDPDDPGGRRTTPGTGRQAHGFTLDLLYNGAGSEDCEAEQRRPTRSRTSSSPTRPATAGSTTPTRTPSSAACRTSRVVPWRCADRPRRQHASGSARPTSPREIKDNRTWAAGTDCRLNDQELVTGEHSGLKILPQQPVDNPNLAPALTDTASSGWLATTPVSREQRQVGPALTVPRYPMNVFYNAGTASGGGRRVQLDLHQPRRRRQRHLRGPPGTSTCLPAPLDTGHRLRVVHRAAGGADRPRARAGQQPAAALHPPVQPRRGPDRLPGAGADPRRLRGPVRGRHAHREPAHARDIGAELQRRAAWNDGRRRAARSPPTASAARSPSQAPAGVDVTATMPAGTRRRHRRASAPHTRARSRAGPPRTAPRSRSACREHARPGDGGPRRTLARDQRHTAAPGCRRGVARPGAAHPGPLTRGRDRGPGRIRARRDAADQPHTSAGEHTACTSSRRADRRRHARHPAHRRHLPAQPRRRERLVRPARPRACPTSASDVVAVTGTGREPLVWDASAAHVRRRRPGTACGARRPRAVRPAAGRRSQFTGGLRAVPAALLDPAREERFAPQRCTRWPRAAADGLLSRVLRGDRASAS